MVRVVSVQGLRYVLHRWIYHVRKNPEIMGGLKNNVLSNDLYEMWRMSRFLRCEVWQLLSSTITACPTKPAPTEHGPPSHGVQHQEALTLSGIEAHKRALSAKSLDIGQFLQFPAKLSTSTKPRDSTNSTGHLPQEAGL